MAYDKLYVSPVLAITHDNGLIVEITKGAANNVVSLWGMYRDDDGNWAYTGTKSGAKNIRLPMNDLVIDFIIDELTKVKAINAKLAKAATKVAKDTPKAPPAGVLPDLDDPAVVAQFTAFIQAMQAQSAAPAGKTKNKPRK